jgi:hypothetical protein
MPDWLLAIILGFVGVSGGYLTFIATRRTGDRARIEALEKRQDVVEKRNLSWQNYAGTLREHIYAKKGPPPPDFPHDIFE